MKLKEIIGMSLLTLLSGCSLQSIWDKGLENYVNIYEEKIKEEPKFYCDNFIERDYFIDRKDEYGRVPALFKVKF